MNAIKVNNISKIYKMYDNKSDRLKEVLNPFKKKYYRDFYALKDISFEVKKGETVGIIGKNGSGKSTLLKIITGVLVPSSGTIETCGNISSLLELGAGFNPEYTGMENIYLNGTIMGYTKEEVDGRIDDILSFADIGGFVYQPVKSYSSGMFVRLAFAVATSIQPQILIVDEALSVGDMFYQAKCMSRMKEMIDNGTTLLFVSHDSTSVKSICQKCILLNEGELIDYDKSDKVLEEYFDMKVRSEQEVINKKIDKSILNNELAINVDNEEFKKRASFKRISNGKASFLNVELLDNSKNKIDNVQYEQYVILRLTIQAHEDIDTLCYGYHIRNHNGLDVVYSDSVIENNSLKSVKENEIFIIDWKFNVSLIQGEYSISCVLSIPLDLKISKVDFCDFIPIAIQFVVSPRKESMLYGIVHWNNSITINKIE